ncbi:DUF3040 domain-containing protein [Devriesea agamarum]|uniref:DUF3040 domain-containing protein n=1 Tax=Devriesea agamarum TaxID=472569 RepID=UPI00071DBC82|nr:DUF3040 domain-containing protein [Devriesea agamarum]
MPLSEYEQRMLAEMERQLLAEDPDLARSLGEGPRMRRGRGRMGLGVLLILAGLALLILAVSIPMVWLGVGGFLVMLAGAILMITPGKQKSKLVTIDEEGLRARAAHPAKGRNGFMRKFEERWDQRGDDRRR